MKFLYLLLLLLLAESATGQVAPRVALDTDTAVFASKRLTAADTVRAIHRLFNKRRTVGSAVIVAAGALAAVGISDVVENGGNAGFFTGPSAYVFVTVLAAMYTAPLYVPGLILRGRYSRKNEAALIADYNATKTIPKKYLQKLKPGLFVQRTAK